MRRLLTTFFLSMAFIGNLNARESLGLLVLTVNQDSSVEVWDNRYRRVFKDNIEISIEVNGKIIHREQDVQNLRIDGMPPFEVIISNPEGVSVLYKGTAYPAPSKRFQVPEAVPTQRPRSDENLVLTVNQDSSVEVWDNRYRRVFKDNIEISIEVNGKIIHREQDVQNLRIDGMPPFEVIISNPEGVSVLYKGTAYPAPSKRFQVPEAVPTPPPLPTGQVPVYPWNYSLSEFFSLGDGTDLWQYDSPKLCSSSCCADDRKGLLGRRWGRGETFGVEQQRWYEMLRVDPGVRYVLRDLQTGTVLAKSQDAEKSWYGASAAKIFIVGALLHANNGSLDPKEWQRVFRLLIRSRNADWTPVQNAAGGGRAVDEFVQETLGLINTRGQRSQNRINAIEATQFLEYAHHNKFYGAEALLRVMANNCWARRRSQKYLPTNVAVGSKTGFWKSFTHEIAYVEVDGKRYGVTVLTNTHVRDSRVSKISGREAVAIVVAGLVRTHLL